MLATRAFFLVVIAACLAAPAPAQTRAPGAGTRQPVTEGRVLSVTTTCFFGPHLAVAQAKALCARQARARLLDAAVAQFSTEPGLAASGLSAREARAFVDGLLAVAPLEEETRQVGDGTAVRLVLRGEESPGKTADKLADFRADPDRRARALAATADRDRQAAEARLAAIPFAGEQEFAAPPGPERLNAETALATHRLVPGMSMPSVKNLLGDPGSLHQAVVGADSYVCAGYGALWLVYRDGLLSCARSRLEYDPARGTDCHCAGSRASILTVD